MQESRQQTISMGPRQSGRRDNPPDEVRPLPFQGPDEFREGQHKQKGEQRVHPRLLRVINVEWGQGGEQSDIAGGAMSPALVHESHHDGQGGDGKKNAYEPHANRRVGENPQAGFQEIVVERRMDIVQGQTGYATKTQLFREPGKPFVNPHALSSQVQKSQGCPQKEDGEQAPTDPQDSLLWLVFHHLAGNPARPAGQ